jgi:hypothetical protein
MCQLLCACMCVSHACAAVVCRFVYVVRVLPPSACVLCACACVCSRPIGSVCVRECADDDTIDMRYIFISMCEDTTNL